MGGDRAVEHRRRVLDYWWMLELFGAPPVPRLQPRQNTHDESRVADWVPGMPLPWQTLPAPRQRGEHPRRWRHVVYLGVYDLEKTYGYLHTMFTDDPDADDPRGAGHSACATVIVDDHGVIVSDSAVLSSTLWGVGRIARTDLRGDDRWADGFPRADDALRGAVDAFTDSRVDTADLGAGEELRLPGAVDPGERGNHAPALDGPAVQKLLEIAHREAGITGIGELATGRIVISSTVVTDRGQGAPAGDVGFLNSFYLDDLAAARRAQSTDTGSTALAEYLTPAVRIMAADRIDVMTAHAVVDRAAGLDDLPKGRWPSEPSHTLALRQQLAVNTAIGELGGARGLRGVNGPPGTGKTTMLRDILAANVVERARRLATLNRPRDAFTDTVYTWKDPAGYGRRIRALREDLTGFEMVVASANNAAVENVSAEIPTRESIAPRWRADADYFADVGSATLLAAGAVPQTDPPVSAHTPTADLPAWGLVAARLGNKGNRQTFRSAFWTGGRRKSADGRELPDITARLKRWADGPDPVPDWAQARARFLRAEERVDKLIGQRRAARERCDALAHALRARSEADARCAQHRDTLAGIGADKAAYLDYDRRLEQNHAHAGARWQRHLAVKPGPIESLMSLGRKSREWRIAAGPLSDQVARVEDERARVWSTLQEIDGYEHRCRTESQMAETERARGAAQADRLTAAVAADRQRFPGHPDNVEGGAAREMTAPWLDAELDAARAELFLAALRLHEDFLANTAATMLGGLRAAVDVVEGVRPPRLAPEKVLAAWQTFFLVVPMVSTTFASIGRMFDGLGSESLGWLLIDEAGQAAPQQAVGAIRRARRVIAVGDPLQLEPVVTTPQKMQGDIAAAYGLDDTWIPPRASVQTLADRAARLGTTLSQGEASIWVSAPLTVHRRCDDPMFSLCNAIAYDGIMVSGVHRTLGDPAAPDQFDTGDGPRIPPSCWFDEPATDRGTHAQSSQLIRVEREIDRLIAAGVDPADIIAISPFRQMSNRLNGLSEKISRPAGRDDPHGPGEGGRCGLPRPGRRSRSTRI